MDRDVTMTDVALSKNRKTALALRGLMFTVQYSTQQRTINQTWDVASCRLGKDAWVLVVPEACICCWCGHQNGAQFTFFLCVDSTAKAVVNTCAVILQTTEQECNC